MAQGSGVALRAAGDALMDAIDLALYDACHEEGCPICRLRLAGERRYLLRLLSEFVNDAFVRERYIASLGFCPQHARQLQALEQDRWGDGLGNAILCEDLLTRMLKALQQHRETWTHCSAPRGWRQRRSRIALPHALTPRSLCRVCELGETLVARNSERLVRAAAEAGELWEAYADSTGLCWDHLRQALEYVSSDNSLAAVRLLDQSINRLQALTAALDSYVESHDYHHQGEVISAEVRESWLHAVAWLAGEEL